MLRIRLARVGKKKQPSYRMVVADSRAPRDGAFVKIIGHYNPLTDPATLVVKEDEAVYWLKKGAKPSDTAAKLLTRLGVMEKAGLEPFIYKGPDVPRGKKGKDGEEPPAATAPTAEAPAEEPAAEAETESKTDESAEELAQTDASDGDNAAEAEDKSAPTE